MGLLGGLLVAGTGVLRIFGCRTGVFVAGMANGETVTVWEEVTVTVGVSSRLTGRRGISAM